MKRMKRIKLIELIFIILISISLLSGIIYGFKSILEHNLNDDRWFLRISVAIIGLGFLYIGELLQKKGNTKC